MISFGEYAPDRRLQNTGGGYFSDLVLSGAVVIFCKNVWSVPWQTDTLRFGGRIARSIRWELPDTPVFSEATDEHNFRQCGCRSRGWQRRKIGLPGYINSVLQNIALQAAQTDADTRHKVPATAAPKPYWSMFPKRCLRYRKSVLTQWKRLDWSQPQWWIYTGHAGIIPKNPGKTGRLAEYRSGRNWGTK